MKKIITTLTLVAFTTACAQSADKIDATFVPSTQYAGWSCNQLTRERNEVVRQVNTLTETQDKKAKNDALATTVAIVLFWPAAFLIGSGSDKAPQLAQAKGDYDAMTQVMKSKGCSGIAG